jgi:hypothetical protein
MDYKATSIQQQINALNAAQDVAKEQIAYLEGEGRIDSANALRFMIAIDEATSRERGRLDDMWRVARWHEKQAEKP